MLLLDQTTGLQSKLTCFLLGQPSLCNKSLRVGKKTAQLELRTQQSSCYDVCCRMVAFKTLRLEPQRRVLDEAVPISQWQCVVLAAAQPSNESCGS